MKSLITLYFTGDLVGVAESNLKLVVWINEEEFQLSKVVEQVPLWDKHPLLASCRVKLILYDTTGQKGLLGTKKELKDMPVIAEHRYQFNRPLNDTIQVDPMVQFGQHLVNLCVRCSTSEFPILDVNPLLMESSIGVIRTNHPIYPSELSKYFQDYNCKVIRRAHADGLDQVNLLKIVGSYGFGAEIIINYLVYTAKSDGFPNFELKLENKKEEYSFDREVHNTISEAVSEAVNDAIRQPLISFD